MSVLAVDSAEWEEDLPIPDLLELGRSLSNESRATAEQAQVEGAPLQAVIHQLLRAVGYQQQGVITVAERQEAKQLLRTGHCHGARRLLDAAAAQRLERARPQCPICFDEVTEAERFQLGCSHVFCRDCMAGHCRAVAFPGCPNTSCDYKLSEEEVGRAGGQERLRAFQDMQLQQAIDRLPDRVECPNPVCRNVMVCEAREQRQRISCHCGWAPFCSSCRQPYHHHKDCGEIGVLREQWAQWVSAGRVRYHGSVQAAATVLRQQEAVQEALDRQRELEADERYKADNCRCCPQCHRAVQKIDGCDMMRCGENYHGGDRQDGCGATFTWSQAPRYRPRVESRPIPRVDIDKARVKGKGIRHFLVSCDGCGAKNLQGPRFRCVHCPEFNLCAACDRGAAVSHPAEHVFEVLFTPEQAYNLELPPGTKVELIGLVQNVMLNGHCGTVKRFLPSRHAYELELCEPFTMPHMDVTVNGGNGEEEEEQEMGLMPGASFRVLNLVPARFVQLASNTTDQELMWLMEASDAQSAARRTVWAGLPEGQRIQLCGRISPVEGPPTSAVQRAGGGSTGSGAQTTRTERDAREELATVASPYLCADSFTVEVDSGGLWRASAADVQPLVSSARELENLEAFSRAQSEARQLNLDLPIGQVVELIGLEPEGQVAFTTEAYDPEGQCYTVRLRREPAEGPESAIEAARLLMAEQYGVNDLLGMTEGQLVDLWNQFGLPRRGLDTLDAYLEQAMGFLPPERPLPLIMPACCVQPLVSDPLEVEMLRERHEVALALTLWHSPGGVFTAPAEPQPVSATTTPTQPQPGDADHDRGSPPGDENVPQLCARCGDVIRGFAVQSGGNSYYHFGCSLEG